MPAKILEFDPNRRIPPRYYTPIAMRGRLLTMPSRSETTPAVGGDAAAHPTASISNNCAQECRKSAAAVPDVAAARRDSCSLRW